MARKSKGFRELIAQENLKKRDKQSFERLKNTVIESGLGEPGMTFAENPEGYEKMSEILIEFVKPFLDKANSHQRREALFSVAVVSWNLAIVPENERQKMLKMMSKKLRNKQDPEFAKDTQSLIEEFIERKLTFFADNNRFITGFELDDRSDSFYISVSSIIPKPK
jgi:hypothetical protein